MNVVSRWLRNARSVSLAQSVLPAVLAVVLALGSPGFNILYSLLAVFGGDARALMDAFGVEGLGRDELDLTPGCVERARAGRGEAPLAG